MANTVKTVSGNTTTYVITAMNASTVTMSVTPGVNGNPVTFSSSGAVGEDALNAVAQLCLQLSNNVTVP